VAEGLRRNAGGLFTKFTNLFSLVGYLDDAAALIPLVREWLAIEADWSTVPGIKARAAVIVAAGKIVTQATPSTVDDAIVAQFEALTQNEALVESVAWLIGRFNAEVPGGDQAAFLAFVERPDVQESLAERQGISLSEIMQVVKLITELVTMLKGMFGGATAPAAPTGGSTGGGLFDF
jgi:hypothetical protein